MMEQVLLAACGKDHAKADVYALKEAGSPDRNCGLGRRHNATVFGLILFGPLEYKKTKIDFFCYKLPYDCLLKNCTDESAEPRKLEIGRYLFLIEKYAFRQLQSSCLLGLQHGNDLHSDPEKLYEVPLSYAHRLCSSPFHSEQNEGIKAGKFCCRISCCAGDRNTKISAEV
ncbi:hypothetical protein llap_4587 [Limosa lapponica baueri]|uniref:Uncharacterized protein n=1 Tax=Limosa lapponica baueri TaxID=1758121 RepID=A0A2I0UGD1_LIMLA|nr:hypothetical protein llap_4587 [Limosa lapponica baueri]